METVSITIQIGSMKHVVLGIQCGAVEDGRYVFGDAFTSLLILGIAFDSQCAERVAECCFSLNHC